MTKNQRAYKKEIQRLKRGIQRARKKGYIIDYDFAIPKRVTAKRLAEIKATRPRDIYKKGIKIDIDTGEILGKATEYLYKKSGATKIDPKQYIEEQKQRFINEPKEKFFNVEKPVRDKSDDYLSDETWADIIINSLYDQVSFNEKIATYVERHIKENIDKYGKVALARAIENSATSILQYIAAAQYGTSLDGVGAYFSDIIHALPFEGSEEEYADLEEEFEFVSTELDWNEV